MITVFSPLTWGIHTTPPPDIPECGFVGELCPPPVQGMLYVVTVIIHAKHLTSRCFCFILGYILVETETKTAVIWQKVELLVCIFEVAA